MPDTDAPQVEPLTLTLEEALQRLYAKGLTLIPPGDGTDSWGIGVAGDSPDEEFDTWHEAVSAVLGMPVVPRDDTAELVAALEAWLAWAAKHQADLYFGDLPESSFTQVGDLVVTSRAALEAEGATLPPAVES